MIFVCDISMVVHSQFGRPSDPKYSESPKDDTPEWVRNHLERVRQHFESLYPDCVFVCAFDHPSRKLWAESCLLQHCDNVYKGDRLRDPDYAEVEAAVLESVQLDDDWQAVIAEKGYEADDVIASIAKQYSGSVVIYGNDRDHNSLLEQGRIGIIKKADISQIGAPVELTWFSEKQLRSDFGFGPDRFDDYLAMLGKDNVPGWAGVGDVKAKQIIVSGADLLDIDVESEELKLNKTQRASYPEFRRLYPVIKAVRTPVSTLMLDIKLKGVNE